MWHENHSLIQFLGDLGKRCAECVAFFSINMCLNSVAHAIEHMMQVVDDARSAQLQDGFLLGPELGERLDRLRRGADPFGFGGVHRLVDKGNVVLSKAFYVDADGGEVDGYGNAVFAVADVEINLWMTA